MESDSKYLRLLMLTIKKETSYIPRYLYKYLFISLQNDIKSISIDHDEIISSEKCEIKVGNSMKLKDIPLGTNVHCVELKPLKGAQLARSAGTSARLVAKEGIYATLRLQSGETRKVLWECRATLGTVSNQENNLKSLGKAGAKRWRGVRPTVRGVAMNPVDHPHGGGEGRTSGGRHPSTPWGVPTKGYKTRKNQRTDDLIIRRRGSRK